MWRGLPGIAPEGFYIIIASAIVGWLFAVAGFTYISVFFILLTFFNMFFFRDPERITPDDDNSIFSPADGKIVDVVKETEPYFLNESRIRVSIFLSILDCHINRFPVSGEVLSKSYREGGYGLAYKPGASADNERLATLIASEKGVRIVMVQVAGLVARRIISYADVGCVFEAGERFGIIKYGSRLDLYIPENWDIRINKGDSVKAGETVIACQN